MVTPICGLAVTDIEAEYERLTAGGMEFHSEPVRVNDRVRSVYGRDPFGNVIELEEVAGRTQAHQPI